MDVERLIEHLELEGPRLLAAAIQAGWDARVPALDWDVRELVRHTGGVHRWATAAVCAASQEELAAAERAVGAGPSDADELAEWFAAGHAALVRALRAAPADLETFTFLPADSARHFWARRQAHETAVHRADAEAAGGRTARFDADFADDGIGELLLGFGARRRFSIAQRGTVELRPDDGGARWHAVFGGERIVARRYPAADVSGGAGASGPEVDAVVSGSSSELYLWLWNRPAPVRIDGLSGLADLWAQTVRVRWG
jgi:uncharacterized protein (TIGR03083 family)